MKIIYITLLLLMISCSSSPKSELSQSENYKELIQRLSNQGNWIDAVELANIQLRKSESSKRDKGYYYLVLGENYRFLEEYELSEFNFRRVIDNIKPNESSELMGEAFYGLGDLYYLKWSYFKQNEALDKSKIYLDSSMIYAKENEQLALESKILYRQGTIFQIQGSREEGEKCFEKGLEIAISISDTIGIIRNDIHKAAELENTGELDSALYHYNRAYQFANTINRNYSEAHALCNLGLYYLDRKEILKSKDYFIKAKFLSKELNHRIVMCRTYYGLSLIEEATDNKNGAANYAKKGLEIAAEKGYKNYEQAFRVLLEKLE